MFVSVSSVIGVQITEACEIQFCVTKFDLSPALFFLSISI